MAAFHMVSVKNSLSQLERPKVELAAALPFVKWVGGKRSLIPYLTPHFPNKIDTYWEPFVGGGAVFFNFSNRIGQAYLSDINEDLINTYKIVQKFVEPLIEVLGKYEQNHKKYKGKKFIDGMTYYQYIRASNPDNSLESAARFIYLNKTCFNGLYRVNKRGQFNVPEGRYANPDICNPERLRQASRALEKATILRGDFTDVITPSGDYFIYCDPPYDGCFTGYQANGFPEDSQARLRNAANNWTEKGATVVLSNADTPAMRKLYEEYTIHEAAAPRNINSNGNGRGAAPELIITNV